MYKFKAPNNLELLNKFYNPNKINLVTKESDDFPYKLHPYVSYAHSPYSYINATCSSGTLGYKKKNRRSPEVLNTMKNYFNIFFIYYFALHKIDFLFFKLNGIFKIFKSLKHQMFTQFKTNFYKLKKIYIESRKLKKVIDVYDENRDIYPKLIGNLVAMASAKKPMKELIPDKKTQEYLEKSMSESDNEFNIRKARLSKLNFKILHYISKYPKFIYIMDTTTYPFNGCRRVRHYKK